MKRTILTVIVWSALSISAAHAAETTIVPSAPVTPAPGSPGTATPTPYPQITPRAVPKPVSGSGSLIALPLSGFRLATWKVPVRTMLLGVYGLFGFHLLLFLALRHAPALEANLINYLWPLGMVVLAPVILPGTRLRAAHLGAALL